MSVTVLDPNTILLHGMRNVVNDYLASEAITPGHLVELAASSGVLKWRKNASATNQPTLAVALNQEEMNKGVDDAYASGDLVEAHFLKPGDVWWALVPSGEDIAIGDLLQSNGDGTLKEATAATATANVARFQALEALGAITVLTRCRVQVIC